MVGPKVVANSTRFPGTSLRYKSRSELGDRRLASAVIVLELSLAGLLTIGLGVTDTGISPQEYLVLIAIVTYLGSFALAWRLHGPLSPPSFYIALLGLFHLGSFVPFTGASGFWSHIADRWFGYASFSATMYLVIAAFLFLSVGMIMGGSRGAPADRPAQLSQGTSESSVKMLFNIGLAIELVGFLLFLIGGIRLNIFSVSYGEAFRVVTIQDPRLLGNSFFVIRTGAIIAMCAARQVARFRVFWGTMVLLAPIFLYGYRGPAMIIMLGVLLAWQYANSQKAKLAAIILVLSAAFLGPAVRLTRSGTLDLGTALSYTSPIDLSAEAGGSVLTLV